MSDFRQTYSDSGNPGDVVMVESGRKTGEYYILLAGLRRGVTWQEVKDWLRNHGFEPNHVVVHGLGGWVRVRGYPKFREIFNFMNGAEFHGHNLIASDINETRDIPIKHLRSPPTKYFIRNESRYTTLHGPPPPPSDLMVWGQPLLSPSAVLQAPQYSIPTMYGTPCTPMTAPYREEARSVRAVPIKHPHGPPTPPPDPIVWKQPSSSLSDVLQAPQYSILPPAQTCNESRYTTLHGNSTMYGTPYTPMTAPYREEARSVSTDIAYRNSNSIGTGTGTSASAYAYAYAAPQIGMDYNSQETHYMPPVPVSESGGQSFEAPGQSGSCGSVAMSRSVASPGSAFTPSDPDHRSCETAWSTSGGDSDSGPALSSGGQSVSSGSPAPSPPPMSKAKGPIIADGSTPMHRSNTM